MGFSDFTGEVQHRLELGTQGEAVRATRAGLHTLGQRLPAGEAGDLAAPLPMEVDHYVLAADHGQRFGWNEVVTRVTDIARAEAGDAAFYAQAVVGLLAEVIPGSEIEQIRDSLPAEYEGLFAVAEAETAPWPTS